LALPMSPSAISVTPPLEVQRTSDLTAATVSQKLADTAPVQPKPTNGTIPLQTLDASKLIFTRTTTPSPVLDFSDQRIKPTSSVCTDHMVTAVWRAETGWDAPELRPYGPLSLMPTASVLHYSTECFEGLKVYRGYDGKLRLFRPDCNARRLLMSSLRISLPGFDPKEVEKLIIALMAVDGPKFLPKSQPGTMLYLRPTIIGTDPSLGMKVPNEAMLFIIASYFADLSGLCVDGMKLLASKNDEVRAWPGGFGFAKVGANYGPSLAATMEAKSKGYHQVLWLFGDDGMVTEAGASNFCVIWRSRERKLQLVTAPLEDKIILDGVTRRSIVELAKKRLADSRILEALEVVERKYTMDEIAIAVEEGRMVEAFACGTAVSTFPLAILFLLISDKTSTSLHLFPIFIIGGKTSRYQWLAAVAASTLPSSKVG
jgi:branched-chain amino acid aminotransferase